MAEFSDAKSGAYCMCTREKCSDECRTYRRFRPKPITNADRIRAMTDEELATLFEEYGDCPPRYCPHDGKGTKITRIDCRECWIDWLRREVDNG